MMLKLNGGIETGDVVAFSKEVPKGVTYISLNKIGVLRDQIAHEIIIRPDVVEDSVLNLCEQILLSFTGVVNKFGPDIINDSGSEGGKKTTEQVAGMTVSSFILESVNAVGDSPSALCWSVIRIYLGVNVDFQRVLLLHMIPINGERNEDISTGGSTTGTALSSILYSAGSLLRKSPFHEFGDSLISVLSEAMNSERFTMNHLMESPIHTTNHTTEHHHQETLLDFAESNDDHSSKSNPPPSVILQDVSRYYPPPLQPLESLVDVGYVRDLQAARAQGMVLRLLEQGEQLDREVRAAEAKCARLMSLLKPTYTRSNVGIPSAPVAKSLSSFPLTLTRRSLMEPTNYDSKLVLLRARRELKAQLSRGLSLQREMGLLVGLVLTQLDEWGADEYSARLLRKTAAVKDRLQVVHHFEMQLLITLHERFRARAAGVSGVGLASNRMFVDSDSSMQTFVQEKFPFLGDQEPVLLECAGALLNARKGTAYITVGHVLFYSMGILLSTVMTVLPLHTVALMTVISASKTVFSATYQQSGGASEAVSTSGVMTELTDCIVLVDVSGQETVLELRGVTPDHPRRVADLIDLLIQEKLYLLRTATDRRVSVTSSVSSSTSSSSFSMESDDHLLHLIDSVPVEPSAVTISSTQSAAVAHPHKEYLVPLVASVSPGLSTADSPSPSHSTQTEVAVMVSDSSKDVKKPIGKTSNLKKFLEKKHTPQNSDSKIVVPNVES